MALGQIIVFRHKRPSFPKDTPPAFKSLAERCWHPKPSSRPSFEEILDELQKMRETTNERPQYFSFFSSFSSPVSGPNELHADDSALVLSTADFSQ